MASQPGLSEERFPQLVHQIVGGNSEALGELYLAFGGNVFRTAYRLLGSGSDAEDITGDVFLGMSAALQSYDHSSIYGFRRWLEKVTVRLAAAHANRVDAAREVALDSARTPAARSDHTIDRLALERALETLTPALRNTFLLKVVEGYSHQDIAAKLGISVRASEVRLHRARRKLRLSLDDAT